MCCEVIKGKTDVIFHADPGEVFFFICLTVQMTCLGFIMSRSKQSYKLHDKSLGQLLITLKATTVLRADTFRLSFKPFGNKHLWES